MRGENIDNLKKLKEENNCHLIASFGSKYIDGYTGSDLINLSDILANKGYRFGAIFLKGEIDEVIKNEKYNNFKQTILSQNPQNRENIIRTFLNIYGENYTEHRADFDRFLKEQGNEVALDSEILNIKRSIELEGFEGRLNSGEKMLSISDIDNMDGYEFEDFLVNLYKKMGYNVTHTKYSLDQGADLVVSKFGETTAVQAKCYSGSVGNDAVQQVIASKGYYQCDKATVITNSEFTRAAIDLANSNDVDLINRDGLDKLIKDYW